MEDQVQGIACIVRDDQAGHVFMFSLSGEGDGHPRSTDISWVAMAMAALND